MNECPSIQIPQITSEIRLAFVSCGERGWIAALSKYAGLVFLAQIVFRLNQDWYGFDNVVIYLYQETRHQYYTKFARKYLANFEKNEDITVKEKRENEAEENWNSSPCHLLLYRVASPFIPPRNKGYKRRCHPLSASPFIPLISRALAGVKGLCEIQNSNYRVQILANGRRSVWDRTTLWNMPRILHL